MRQFRFGVNFFGPDSVDGWVEHCQIAERLGYDAVHAPDHLGSAAPFAMLAAAAVATERLRLATYVVNNGFWNPHILAREAATVDRLSAGRLELGLGLGYVKKEFDAAGIAWEPHGERLARLERSIDALDALFADDGQPPLPVQRPRPPLMLGGHGERLLALAAGKADIVAFGGARQRPGATLGELQLVDIEEVADRVELVRQVAGERLASLEFGALFQYVAITDDAQQHAAGLAERYGLTVDEFLSNPFLLVGTVEEVATKLIANRERFGFSYLVTHQPYRDAFGQVIPRLRELADEPET